MNARISQRLFVRARILVFLAGMALRAGGLAGEYFLFTSFRGNGEDGLHLALSTNGYHWQALNRDRSFLKPEVGGYKIMRDPCLAEGPDGRFHLFFKDERKTPLRKNLRYARADRAEGPFGPPSEPFPGD